MVLGIRLIAGLALLAGACSSGSVDSADRAAAKAADTASVAVPVEQAFDSVLLGGVALELVEANGACALRKGGATLSLGIAAPCYFLRRGKEAAPAAHDYPGRGSVVLVGGPASELSPTDIDVGTTPDQQCSRSGRGVIVKDGKLFASKVLDEKQATFCPWQAPDEKYYHGVVHQPYFGPIAPLG